MENKELEFLGKIKQVIILLDEIDEVIKSIPSTQQKNDYLLSDYLHLIESDEFGTVLATNITKEIKTARNERRAWNNIKLIADSYIKNKYKLMQTEQRKELTKILTDSVNNLHQDYKYRILSDEDIKELHKEKKQKKSATVTNYKYRIVSDGDVKELHKEKTQKVESPKKKRKKRKSATVTKEWLEAQLKIKTAKEIAEELGISESSVTNLKKRLNIEVRNKKKNS